MRDVFGIPLKKCPFCGSRAKMIYEKDAYKVFCANVNCLCGVGWAEDANIVAANWNKRINNKNSDVDVVETVSVLGF